MTSLAPLRGALILALAAALAPAGAAASEVGVAVQSSPKAVATFSVDAPSTALSGPTPITGMIGDESPAAIDQRPTAAGGVYMLGVRQAADGGHLYRLDPNSGVATAIGDDIGPLIDRDNGWDIDFDPVTGFLRVLGAYSTKLNFVLDPDSGEVVGAPGTPTFFPAGDPNAGESAQAAALGHTNSVPGATSTTAYVLTTSQLAMLGSPGGSPFDPASGRLTTIGEFTEGSQSFTPEGLDISGATGRAYALLIEDVPVDKGMEVVPIDLATAATGPRARTPFGYATDITLLPTSVMGVAAPAGSVAEGATARLAVTRGGPGTGPVAVGYQVVPQTAAANDLGGAAAGTLNFGPGESAKEISVPVTAEAQDEGAETFLVRLTSATGGPAGGAVVGAGEAAVTVTDPLGPKLGIRPRRVRLDRRGRARLRLSCPAAVQGGCTGLLELKRKVGKRQRRIGKRRFSVPAGKTKRVRVKVGRRARRRIARRGKLRVRAVVTARDAVSAAAVSGRRVVLLRRR